MIFHIYFCHYYLATNKKIAIIHLWHAVEPPTMYHLIAKDKELNNIFEEKALTAIVFEL